MDTFSKRIQTVGELTRSLKGLLETSFPFINVVGEISNLRRPHSGHIYFTLKDNEAQLRVVLFKTQQRYLDEELRNGLEIVCRGRISLYSPRGEYQLVVDVIDGKGEGALQIAFDELKQRLATEGLFDQAHKRPLPFLPRKVGVITSPDGAALHDFLHMAATRFPGLPIEIYPVRVQGEGAASEIADALELANERGMVDVIVLCRGGGSIEDLWAFNEEHLARAIYASDIPVVTAVGHEVDYTISDFVADHRAPTPTAAAEAVMPESKRLQILVQEKRDSLLAVTERLLIGWRQQVEFLRRTLTDPSVLLAQYLHGLDQRQHRILQSLQLRLRQSQTQLDNLTIRLMKQNPTERLSFQKQWVAEMWRKTAVLTTMHLERKAAKLQRAAGLLDAVSPLAVLGRGYAIARTGQDGEVIRDTSQVNKGDNLEILLSNGVLDCKVIGKHDGR
ncbi:MAG: exodeoxyribonuclease VII large subunit [Desulfobulbaceae bacterium]|nr:exodeoxyribonuclease VII large subunit [Desulfobulbaceae bacterium]